MTAAWAPWEGRAVKEGIGNGRAYAAIVALAAVLLVSALIAPPMVHDSFWIDFVWADQFTAELRRGIFYPRWLPLSHDGLGSPVFYFYPPFGFYIAALFGLLGAPTYASLILAFGAGLAGSGIAMHLWLKGWAERPLAGACFYMIAPYHLCDFYFRGALAEFTAFIWLPLVALGIRRAAAGRGVLLLSFAYAALILSHLPAALLASLFLVAPYSLLAAKRAGLIKIALALALGCGLAAVYLVPALTLQDTISAEKLWAAPQFRPEAWSFFHPERWIERKAVLILIYLTAASAMAAAVMLIRRREPWAALALLCCILITGVLPALWSLPIIEKVQFPWRALTVVEFALATAVACSRGRPLFTIAAVSPALLASGIALAPAHPPGPSLAFLRQAHPDVIEYLPPGATKEVEFKYTMRATEAARKQPPVRMDGDRSIVRTYYYPAWHVLCQGREAPSFPDPRTRLLSYRGKDCTIVWRRLDAENIGAVISLVALSIAAGLAMIGLPRRRMSVSASSP